MINKERIVPIQKVDFLTLVGTILNIHGTSYDIISSDTVGNFVVEGTGAAGVKLANQPVKSLDFAEGVTGGTVYFVAAYDFEGVKVAGAAATITEGSAEVKPDGITLYSAVLATNAVTITAISPVIA